MINRWWAAAAVVVLGAGSASAQERGFESAPVPVVVLPGDESPSSAGEAVAAAEPPGVAVDLFGGPLLFGSASEVRDDFTLFSGLAMRGISARDLLGAGDLLETGIRAGYGVVEVELESAIREEFVIIAGGEPFALTGSNPVQGAERLAMLAVTVEALYAFAPAKSVPVVPFVVAGGGFVQLTGDRGEESGALRFGGGLEWRVGPTFAVTLEVSDLLFRADVLGHGTIHAWGVMAGVRWRF